MSSNTDKEYLKLEGNYTYVGFDIDTTGRRLIDEIVHIAAYTPEYTFSQHIMPLMNLNPGARNRHQIRVITVGFFRMLKSMKTYKVIKTKTEISTINEFLEWLEKTKGDSDGIILVYHDQPKLLPYMVIEKMKKFNLYERFSKTVKAFVNGYMLGNLTEKGRALKYLPLSANYKVHIDKLEMEGEEPKDFEGDAAVRAKLSYDICKLMSYEGEKKDLDDKELNQMVNTFISSKASPLDREIDELLEMEENISRQTEMRDIFITYFSTSRYHRRRALTFRTALADAKHDKNTLQEVWNSEKREGFEKLVKELESIKEEVDREELVNILDHHFDEAKQPLKPLVRSGSGGRSNYRHRRASNMQNGGSNQRNQNGNYNNQDNRRSNSAPRRNQRYNRNGNDGRRRYSNRRINNEKDGMIHKDEPQQQLASQCDVAAN